MKRRELFGLLGLAVAAPVAMAGQEAVHPSPWLQPYSWDKLSPQERAAFRDWCKGAWEMGNGKVSG